MCEIEDARIPQSSRNPDVDELTAGKPRLMVLNRVDQADPAETKKWAAAFRAQGFAVLEANARGGVGTEKFAAAVRELLKDKLAAYAEKGQVGRTIRVMVLGIPNVGKSTFINKVAKRKTAQSRGPAGCHPLQAVGARWTPRWSCWIRRGFCGQSLMTQRLASDWPLQELSRMTCWTSRNWPAI